MSKCPGATKFVTLLVKRQKFQSVILENSCFCIPEKHMISISGPRGNFEK
jgi:hypothetical protein